MAGEHCTEADRKVIAECLNAAAYGPFFPDWEFHTLFGLTRTAVAEIASNWLSIDNINENLNIAITNALGNLAGYPHGQERVWHQYISVSQSQVLAVLERWKNARL